MNIQPATPISDETIQQAQDVHFKKIERLGLNIKQKGQCLTDVQYQKWRGIPYSQKKKNGIALDCQVEWTDGQLYAFKDFIQKAQRREEATAPTEQTEERERYAQGYHELLLSLRKEAKEKR